MRGNSLLNRTPVGALRDMEQQAERFRKDYAAHTAARPDDTDIVALNAWEDREAKLAGLVQTAERAIERQRPLAEAYEAEQAKASLQREAADLRREVEAAQKRIVRDYPKLAPPLAELIGYVDDVSRRVTAMNVRLRAAGQPPITGAEAFRASEPVHHPEASHMIRRWVGPDGTACTFTKPDPKRPGESIPARPGSWREIEVKVVDSPERVEPGRMPPLLADEIRLPALRFGESPFWPQRGRTS